VLDVDATRKNIPPDFALLEQLAGECFMPLSYGGGIHSVDTARRVMGCGIEKVIVNSAAFTNPGLVTEIASVLGSSSTVVSCDVTRSKKGITRFDHVTRRDVRENVVERLNTLVGAGAGEVIVQSVDRDGTLTGPDIDTVATIARSISVPVVYAGGVASLDDSIDVWRAGASGVAAGAWFVFRGPHRAVLITYPKYDLIQASFSRLQGYAAVTAINAESGA
jgi:cyclase